MYMRKFYLLCLSFTLTCAAMGQDISKTGAIALVEKNSRALALSNTDIENSIVSSAYHNKMSNTDLVYLQQTYKGLPVLNKIQTLAFKNGILVYQSGLHLQSPEKRTGNASATPAVSAENAVKTAMANKKLQLPALFKTLSATPAKIVFEKAPGITDENISAELMWVPINDDAKA